MTPDLTPIRAALSAGMYDLARFLCGEPNRRMSSRRELRFGKKGSLAIAIAGPKAGSWYDHETSEGGGPLDLIMAARECSFRDALDTAQDFLGGSMPEASPAPPDIILRATDDDDEEKRIARALSYWKRSHDPRGTVVETYLASRCRKAWQARPSASTQASAQWWRCCATFTLMSPVAFIGLF